MVCSRTTAIVNRRLDRLGDEGPQSYRIRAKTLNHNQDSALQRFLQAQRIDVQQTYERIFNEENHSRIREWEKLKQTLPKTSRKESFKRFIFEEELEAYRKLRRENKAVKLLEAVFKGITLHHRIHPSLGECVFFEFILHNSYPEPINCIIEIDEPALSVVTDKDTWEFFKRANQIATPMEKNLFNITNQENGDPKIEVFLKPNEHLHIPFLYDDLKYVQKEEGAVQDTKVIFRRWDNQDVISILALTIEHRPYCLDASYRFFWHRETNFERTMAVENLKQRVGAVRCTDPTVKVQIRNVGVEQQLSLSAISNLEIHGAFGGKSGY
ncbi:hypothetical protein WR25_10383 [Diploscapter pachys]|uniref:NPHP4 Ig-like domain-containing protein n=1 Tax=Diploscapter pachys TaxID=2018661 RepID=A0A2A2KZ38_9BILA|nr:hypothetical protein WR25_10383 [Diploscapter pachys]